MKIKTLLVVLAAVALVAPSVTSAQVDAQLLQQEKMEGDLARQVPAPLPGTVSSIKIVTPVNSTVKRTPGRVIPISWKKSKDISLVNVHFIPKFSIEGEYANGYPALIVASTSANRVNLKMPNVNSGTYVIRVKSATTGVEDSRQIVIDSGAPDMSSLKIQSTASTATIEVAAASSRGLSAARAPYYLVVEQHKNTANGCVEAKISIPVQFTARSLTLKGSVAAAGVSALNQQCKIFAWVENKAAQKSNIIPSVSITKSTPPNPGTTTPPVIPVAGDVLSLTSQVPVPTSQKYSIDADNGVQGARLLDFTLQAGTGSYKVTSISTTVFASPTVPTTLYLYDGNTLIASKSVRFNNETIVFSNLSVPFVKDQVKTLSLRVDLPANTQSGTAAAVRFSGMKYVNSSGLEKYIETPIMGAWHSFNKARTDIRLVGTPTITKTTDQMGRTSSMSAAFSFNVSSFGGTTQKPDLNSFTIEAFYVGSSSFPTAVGYPVTIPNTDIANGAVAEVTVVSTITPNMVPGSGLHKFKVTKIKWVLDGVVTEQTSGLESFVTPFAAEFRK